MPKLPTSVPSYGDWLTSSKPYPSLSSKEAHHAIEKLQNNILRSQQGLWHQRRRAIPYKQWKLTLEDVDARAKWDKYVEAVDEMFDKTHIPDSPWNFIPAEDKHYARVTALEAITKALRPHYRWIEAQAQAVHVKTVRDALKELGVKERNNF